MKSKKLWFPALTLLAFVGCSDSSSPGSADSLTGELDVFVANYGSAADAEVFLTTDSGARVRLILDAFPGIATGTRVSVRGQRLDAERFDVDSLEVDVPDLGPETVDQGLTGQPVLRRPRVALLLANWTAPDSQTVASVTSTLLTGTNSTRNHYLENSYGQVDISGDVFGWYTIPAPSGCDYQGIRRNAEAAATAAGVNLAQYDHIGYYFPRTSVCGWAGLGGLGSPTRPAKNTWYNGATGGVIVHELGHNFGLYHSRSLSCGGASIAPTASCTFVEYGDLFDPMGRGGLRHFNAYSKFVSGWYGRCNGVTAPAGGTFEIAPSESPSNGVQLLRVPMARELCPQVDPPGLTSCQYMVEYRQPIGFDARNGNVSGVLVYANSATTRTNPSLLDMTPNTSSGNAFSDAQLGVGRTFSDPNGVRITVVSATAAAATVRVEVPNGSGSATCLDGTTFSGATPNPPPPAPTCTDRARNGAETDVDCGGATCTKCANGLRCSVAADCASNVCNAGVCAAPSGGSAGAGGSAGSGGSAGTGTGGSAGSGGSGGTGTGGTAGAGGSAGAGTGGTAGAGGSAGAGGAPTGGGVRATIRVNNEWAGGYCADVVVANAGTTGVTGWTTVIDLNQASLSSGWNATLTTQGELMTALPISWNGSIAPGSSVAFGYCATKLGTSWQPVVASTTSR